MAYPYFEKSSRPNPTELQYAYMSDILTAPQLFVKQQFLSASQLVESVEERPDRTPGAGIGLVMARNVTRGTRHVSCQI
jgi:hypothetical protein